MKLARFIPGVIWFIISTYLLVLPGSDLPHNSFFDFPYFDKLVHLTMFFLLSLLFSIPFISLPQQQQIIKRWVVNIALSVLAYGIIMEFVQKFWVAGRSFDLADIVFDALGTSGGMLVAMQFATKKIGPDGNRGRNQN